MGQRVALVADRIGVVDTFSLPIMAEALAPGHPQHTVGIRPGEKLHEILITADDSRSTLELDDRYIITPAFNFWSGEDYFLNDAKPVDEGFEFASDTNIEWLEAESLMRLLEEKDAVS